MVLYCLPRGIKMSTVGTGSQKFSHGEKAQLGTPADCLDFPGQFLLDGLSTVFVYSLSQVTLVMFAGCLQHMIWGCLAACLRLVIHSLLFVCCALSKLTHPQLGEWLLSFFGLYRQCKGPAGYSQASGSQPRWLEQRLCVKEKERDF